MRRLVNIGIVLGMAFGIGLTTTAENDSLKTTPATPDAFSILFLESQNLDGYIAELSSTVDKLRPRNEKATKPQNLLKSVFYRIHRQYLRRYRQYSSLEDVMQSGEYDCVSGTALYAYVLDELGFDYTLHETEFHIYMIVSTSAGSVLIECTDPQYGFVTQPRELDTRVREYKSEGNRRYQGEIDLIQLAGLQFYNLAVEAYNRQEGVLALELLEQGIELYPSNRLLDFRNIILSTLGLSINQ